MYVTFFNGQKHIFTFGPGGGAVPHLRPFGYFLHLHGRQTLRGPQSHVVPTVSENETYIISKTLITKMTYKVNYFPF